MSAFLSNRPIIRNVLKKPFATTIRLVIAAISVLLVVGCVGIKETHSQHPVMLSNNTLRVGTTGDFMPFSYRVNGSSELRGVDIVFGRQLGDAMGVDVQFVQTTWPTLIDDLLASKFDVGLSGITITAERQKVASFSRSIMSSGKVAITRDENIDRFKTIANINQFGVRVIVNPGGTNEEFARQHFPRSTIILNEENITVFNKIISGAADVMVTDAVEAAVQESIHPVLGISNRDAPFNSFEFGILLPQDSALKVFVDDWLETELARNTYQDLFDAELDKIEIELGTTQH